MKMWKKFAAALLVAAMALTMLTACGGSGIVRDTEQEKNAVALAQKAATGYGFTLTEDETATNIAAAALPKMVSAYSAVKNEDVEAYAGAMVGLNQKVVDGLTAAGKKGKAIPGMVENGPITEKEVQNQIETLKKQVEAGTVKLDFTPAKIGAAVTMKDGNTLYVIVVTE